MAGQAYEFISRATRRAFRSLATGVHQAAGHECESSGGTSTHDNALLLEYQPAPAAGRVWLCLDCVLDALEAGEFTSLEWTHKMWGQLIPKGVAPVGERRRPADATRRFQPATVGRPS